MTFQGFRSATTNAGERLWLEAQVGVERVPPSKDERCSLASLPSKQNRGGGGGSAPVATPRGARFQKTRGDAGGANSCRNHPERSNCLTTDLFHRKRRTTRHAIVRREHRLSVCQTLLTSSRDVGVIDETVMTGEMAEERVVPMRTVTLDAKARQFASLECS